MGAGLGAAGGVAAGQWRRRRESGHRHAPQPLCCRGGGHREWGTAPPLTQQHPWQAAPSTQRALSLPFSCKASRAWAGLEA